MFFVNAKYSHKQYPYINDNLSFHGFIQVEVLKNTALESSQVHRELKEKCDKAHFENRIAIIDYVTKPLLVSLRNKSWKCQGVKLLSLSFFLCSFCIHMEYVVYISYGFFQVYKTELQLMRVIGCHPLNDPVFISMANNAGLNLSDVRRSLLRAPTYPSKVGMQQVQNQNFPHTGWGNNQQNKYQFRFIDIDL